MRRPNILLITADQWRGDCLSIAGHPVVRTPAIDRLAARGTVFPRHYAQAVPCGPSRASLYTGLYQMNHRVVRNGTPLDRRHDNLALAMGRLGYRPTLFGYTDQAVDPRTVASDSPWLRTYEGILPGFETRVYLPENPEAWLDWLRRRGAAVPNPWWMLQIAAGGALPRPTNSPPRYDAASTQTAFLTDAFLDWLGEQGETPWFAHLSFLAPHPPFIVPEPYNRRFAPEDGPPFRRAPSREREAAIHAALAYWLAQSDGGQFVRGADPPGRWDDCDFRTVRAVYWGMIAEVDHQIGRIVDSLAAAGMADDTVVVFTSDHGEMLGDHWALGKFGFHEQSYHVPLVISDPRRPGGRRVEAFTESVDILPTVLALAGDDAPGHIDGRSLLPFLDGLAPSGWRDAVHFEFDFREVSTGIAQATFGLDLDSCSLAVHRSERFKYVHFAGLPPLLFDLADDPDELVDRSGDPAYAAVRLDCAERLLAWRARHLDRTWTGVELTADGPVDARSA